MAFERVHTICTPSYKVHSSWQRLQITVSSRKRVNRGKERLSFWKWFVTQICPGLFPDKVMDLNKLLKQVLSKVTPNNTLIETRIMRIAGKSNSLLHTSCTRLHVFMSHHQERDSSMTWDWQQFAISISLAHRKRKHPYPPLLCSRSFGLISAWPTVLQPLFYPSL